jgi:cell division protein FtsQ
MSTVKRKTTGVRRSAAAKTRAAKARTARNHTQGGLNRVLSLLPFDDDQLHRIFLAIIIGAGVALAWFIASLAGVPALAQNEVARLAADAGFEVRRVRVTGVQRMNELKIYERALSRRDRPMPLVDLAALREELVALPWVEDARVSRQLPDMLSIDVVERTPHAVLRRPDRLVLIDGSGVELEPISEQNARGMLVVEGPGAARQVERLGQLLEAAPALRGKVMEAEWVGNRRWDLTFTTDQVLALPQGEKDAATALIQFARLDGQNRLLGGKVATFDMRAPERIYMRVPGRAAQVLGEGGDN